ncbi:radical SAM family heme chaperone HemW [Hyphobacterium sp. HN65]|uniref:Heme chaperone HemW n=1 Tax=Hyphobacterium lacteum TaxID=3116575 RepID=A0ABU7LRW8_9PROT|nr:radical SAM family heme chaperone HemW [Hyphobacterium sp. HN65]MEE2526667.1 radical SAM family heme chaperone HemW [Hyphobacterium sp. HN65]
MTDAPLGLYVHWPYCARICPYCDFNVYKARGDDEALFQSLVADLGYWAERLERRSLVSIHFGGGTPSLMTPAQIGELIGKAELMFGFAPLIEIGLEANPNDSDGFEGFRAAGINRLSLGVQSFQDDALVALGRDHDGAAAHRSHELARKNFDAVSLDLIYAREGQTLADWEAELTAILSEQPGHVSAYQLTIEPGTAFDRRVARGELIPPGDSLGAELYTLTQTLCADAGMTGYEISNHCREGQSSRHNRLYWEGADWIGIGPGAHGRMGNFRSGGRVASTTVLKPAAYIEQVTRTGCGSDIETLSALDEARERILMGLRISDGLDIDRITALTGHSIDLEEAGRLERQGLIGIDDRIVRLTPDGRLYADGIAQLLCP